MNMYLLSTPKVITDQIIWQYGQDPFVVKYFLS